MYTKIIAIVATIATMTLVMGCGDKEEDTGDTSEVSGNDTAAGEEQ